MSATTRRRSLFFSCSLTRYLFTVDIPTRSTHCAHSAYHTCALPAVVTGTPEAKFIAQLGINASARTRAQWVYAIHNVTHKGQQSAVPPAPPPCPIGGCAPFTAPCSRPYKCKSTWHWPTGFEVEVSRWMAGYPRNSGHDDKFCAQQGSVHPLLNHGLLLSDVHCQLRAEFTCKWCESRKW